MYKYMPKKNTILYRIVKIIDIGYVSMMYITFAIGLSYLYDTFLGEFNKEVQEKKSTVRILLELIAVFWVYGIIIYIVRNIVKMIPFPLNNIGGFDHSTLKDLRSAGMFTVVFFYFQKNIKARLQHVFDRIHNTA